jgi:hypothetical protein
MRRRIAATGILAAAATFAALAWTANPASAVTAAASSAIAGPAASAQPVAGLSVALNPSEGSRQTAINPDCVLSYIPDKTGKTVNAHISTFLLNRHNVRAVKVNAQVKCRRVARHLFVQVTLWKTGLIIPHSVRETSASESKGNLLKNQKTWKQCKNRQSTTYYGTAYASVWFQGVKYASSLQTPKKVPLACGT